MPKLRLKGEIVIPPDKSMSHRSLIFGSIASVHSKEKIKIKNISLGEDCTSTMKILETLGVGFEFVSKRELIIDASKGFKKGNYTLDCGNSGTTTRLLAGFLSSIEGLNCTLAGDASLSKRPMKRVIEPLVKMGAKITSNEGKLPLKIEGAKLKAISYHSPIPSAQVKSCLMLAGLEAQGVTEIFEDTLSRNHSEILFEYLGANLETGKDERGYFSKIRKSKLNAKDIEVTGDISSAAFFMVAAAIVPDSEILIKNVGVNPTRTGILDVFKEAGVDFELLNVRKVTNEPCADILVRYTKDLKPFRIEGDLVPRLIDEIPVLAVLASRIEGKSTVVDAKDLRNKESDRILTIVNAFKELGIEIEELEDGFEITGSKSGLKSACLKTHLDHRLAMSYYVLGLIAGGEGRIRRDSFDKKDCKSSFVRMFQTELEKDSFLKHSNFVSDNCCIEIEGFDCVNTSFPEFLELMDSLQG